MNRFICLHGHFYQPPRENPWLEEIEQQDSAYPFHDWNERITSECYGPNTASRILDHNRQIVNLINNYSKLSFNVGPTLLTWMERHSPDIYQAIIDADLKSRDLYSGHGSAIAQVYNHIILPLANRRDAETQVIWGIRDFEFRFGRKPEGMWLAETAANLQTLDLLAEHNIRFTILSPMQAARTRKLGQKKWSEVDGGKVDPKHPYICHLPSGRTIIVFFYDGPIAQDIAFGGLLNNGENMANRLMGVFSPDPISQLVHVATDGESYGHHHRFGDMAVAYCLHRIEALGQARLTIYGEYLDLCPAEHEAEIHENSSWSCAHGIERWRNDCGCSNGGHPGWHQKWRAPLRDALDWLRDEVAKYFESKMSDLVNDPWKTRNEYIEVLLKRDKPLEKLTISQQFRQALTKDQRVLFLKLLEMQRHAMFMFTSCGWFFEEISGIETVQIIAYAARAIQLALETGGPDLEKEFRTRLDRAPSNIPALRTGKGVYDTYVKVSVLDLKRVAAHYAVSSLFHEYDGAADIYSYTVSVEFSERFSSGKYTLVIGKVALDSKVTRENSSMEYAVLHFGDYNISAGIRETGSEELFNQMSAGLRETFEKSDMIRVIEGIETYFGENRFSLWHLFRDEQRKVLRQIANTTLDEVEVALRQIRERHYPFLDVMHQMGVPLPRIFARIAESIHDTDLTKKLEASPIDAAGISDSVQEAKKWSLDIDRVTAGFTAGTRVNAMVEDFSKTDAISTMQQVCAYLEALSPLGLELNLWKAQNICFSLFKNLYPKKIRVAATGDESAQLWLSQFQRMARLLSIKVD